MVGARRTCAYQRVMARDRVDEEAVRAHGQSAPGRGREGLADAVLVNDERQLLIPAGVSPARTDDASSK